MIDLVEIIQTRCVPQRNCLLTVTEEGGENGFLYFKDSQLIEVNQGGTWGKHAFQLIINWTIVSYNLSDLPVGIKRTLWEPVDSLIEDIRGEGAAEGVRLAFRNLPSPPAATPQEKETLKLKRESQRVAFSTIHSLPGFMALFVEQDGQHHLITTHPPENLPDSEWLAGFIKMALSLGSNLGAGNLNEFFLQTDQFMAWKLQIGKSSYIVLGETHLDADSFEAQLRESLGQVI